MFLQGSADSDSAVSTVTTLWQLDGVAAGGGACWGVNTKQAWLNHSDTIGETLSTLQISRRTWSDSFVEGRWEGFVDLCFLSLAPQPLDMNSVESARHNLSEATPPTWTTFLNHGALHQPLWPRWGGGGGGRREVRNRRPKLWHLLVLFSCGVEATAA